MFKKKDKNIITMPSGTKLYKEEKFAVYAQYEHYVMEKLNEEIHPIENIKQALFDYEDELNDGIFNANNCVKYVMEHLGIISFNKWLDTEFLNQTEFFINPEWDKKREETLEIVKDVQARLRDGKN